MNKKTVVNPNNNATAINPNLVRATAVNPSLTERTADIIPNETRLNNKYSIVKRLNIISGEADLYLCRYRRMLYIAKVYRRQRAIKPEVISALEAINSPYIATIFDTGIYNGHTFEILPYYRNGSLQGKRFSLSELKTTIIPCINEGLKALHKNGIIHKDLKPSNIMLSDDRRSVAIIDFGISSIVEEGNTVLVTKTGMTPDYSAPETFKGVYLEESDYYSFGITLYELFCGCTPYKNMTQEEIIQLNTVQRIPFPSDMPKELQELIAALTFPDITERHDKSNPNRRWTYAEVANWCNGKGQIIPGDTISVATELSMPVYTFKKQRYSDIPALVKALATNWNDGKRQLYRGLMSGFFKNFNPEIAGYCMDAEEEAQQNPNKEDVVFWDLLYKIYPELSGFYWMGQTYDSISALGQDMLERLWRDDKSNYSYWDSILSNKLLTNFLNKMESKNDGLAAASAALETSFELNNQSARDALMNYYTMAYLLSGQKIFCIDEKKFENISELIKYMKQLLDASYSQFENFCHLLIDYDDTLNVQFEAWLIALGKRKELDSWKMKLIL